jgi:hypothetical protein
MAKARFVITLISLHEDKRASLLPRLEESWKGDVDIGWSKTGRDERSTISLELLQGNLCGVCGTKTWNRFETRGETTKASAYRHWPEHEGQGQNEIDCRKGSADEDDKAEKEESRKG